MHEPPAISRNVDFYDDYYNKPSWWFAFRYDTQIKRKTILWLLRKVSCDLQSKAVLEIGFGSGVALFSFSRDSQLYGIEVSESAVQSARSRALRIGFQQAEFVHSMETTLPWGDERFDVVIASHVLEHVADTTMLMREIVRVLKPGGRAVILVPINERFQDPKHVRQFTPQSLRTLVRTHGLDVLASLENELLFYLVERFYFGEWNRRLKFVGPMLAAAFNVPLAILPFGICRFLDRAVARLGYLPRQAGIVAEKGPRAVGV